MKRFEFLFCLFIVCIVVQSPRSIAFGGCVLDSDGDGICDITDICPNTIPMATVDLRGCPVVAPGDFDNDGDVDLADYDALSLCLTGPGSPTSLIAPCPDADLDFDLDVDINDVAAFGGCFSGTNQPADPNCVPHTASVIGGCLRIVGTGASTLLALRLQPGNPAIVQVDVHDDGTADFSFNRTQFFCINIFARGGNDQVRIDDTHGPISTTEITTIDGGTGHDTLLGGAGPETFLGGDGNDFVRGGLESDTIFLGANDDTSFWQPGDGDDLVEGEAGRDTLMADGSNATESIFISDAGATRLVFFRDIDNVTIDGDGIEQVDFRARGGADIVFIGTLGGSDVLDVNVELEGAAGSGTGDTQADSVIINGTLGNDQMAITGSGARVSVTGLSAAVHITNPDPLLDRLTLNTLDGDDTLTAAGLAADVIILTLNGGLDNDKLTGSQGDDVINGQEDDDVLIGSGGDDQLLLGPGDDRSIWNPGDDTDLVEGDIGSDTVEVNGGSGDEDFTVTANGTRVRFDRLSPAPFSIDIGTSEILVLNANAGDDSLACTGNLAALIKITSDGGPGKDTLLGSNGVDLLLGGDGDDFIDGQQGNDFAFLGAGDDVFQWDPGDGSDTVEGQGDHDTLLFNGSAGAEIFDFSANGGRLRFTRNLGNIVMDCDDVEQVDLNALGNTDTIVVSDLAGTDVVAANVRLAGTIGGMAGDAQMDNVIVSATNGVDTLAVTGAGTSVAVTGLSAAVIVTFAESGIDRLTVNGLGGNDSIVAASLPAGVIDLTLSGGTGDDNLTGSAGNDIVNGDEDNDTVRPGDGDDTAFLGLGNDRFIWNPGDDTDVVEGQTGTDTVEVNGGNGDEVFTATANGARVRFDRLTPAPFALDIGDCDVLELNAHGGNDSFSATGNLLPLISFTIDGGAGDDDLFGSNGIDTLIGGDDDDFIDGQQGGDTAFLGAGDDVFQWDPGDGSDTVEGQAGMDVLLFNGSAGAEIFDFSANGGRLRFTRNLGNIVMDCDGLEQVDLNALGGVDNVVVNDLSATNVLEVNLNLAGTIGGILGDAAADSVTINATGGDDTIFVSGTGVDSTVLGLAAQINLTTSEFLNDNLRVNMLAGDDVLDASGLASGVIRLTVDGGDDDDVITGSDGPDTLLGGNGDDVLIGGPGLDILDGGSGTNTIVQ